jgi:hypothetical protein
MSFQKAPPRAARSARNGSNLNVRFGPESISNYVRAFSKSVFHHEISDSVSAKESVIALTDDESDIRRIVAAAEVEFPSAYFVVASNFKRKLLSRTAQICCPVVSLHTFYLNLVTIPDGSCVVLEDLWLISNPTLGSYLEQILMLLGPHCILILISKPFSNIPIFYHWLCSIRPAAPRIIEAPFERCPSSYFVLRDPPSEPRLIRNSALALDSLSLSEELFKCKPDFPSKAALDYVIANLLRANCGPILVVVPSVHHLDPDRLCLSSKSSDFSAVLAAFQSAETSVLFVTTKVAEGLFIPTHSIIITSFLKYDGVICRDLQPCEFHHLARSVGRSGIDTHGNVITALLPHLPLSYLTNTLVADIPWLTPHFTIDFSVMLNCVCCSVDDVDEFASKSFNGFCQAQVLPIFREQLASVASALPPKEIGDTCMSLNAIETAISTLCTHPLNLRRLLVKGRVVRIRPPIAERPWGICVGASMCGTVTIAMKGVADRSRNQDGKNYSLVTVPISEVLSVSSVVKLQSSQSLQEFDPAHFLGDQDCDLYNGNELVVGNEKLRELHQELNATQKKLEPGLSAQWREIAELLLKQHYLKVKADAMSKPLGTARAYPPLPAALAADGEMLAFIRRCEVSNVAILHSFIKNGNFGRWTPLQILCALPIFVQKSEKGESGLPICQEVVDLWKELKQLHHFDAAILGVMANVQRWLTEKIEPEIAAWRIGSLVKRIGTIVKALEGFEQLDGHCHQKLEECRHLILQSPNQYLFS